MKLLSAIKKDMEFNKGLYSLVEVLKEIAIAQYRMLEKRLQSFDPVFSALGSIYRLLDAGRIDHPLLRSEGRQSGVIALTSDAGLLGGLNMGVMNQAIKEAEKTRAKLIIVGERGQIYAQESGLPFVTFKGVRDETRLEQALELRDYILQEELAGRLGELVMVYPFSLSIVSQQVKTLPLLPYKGDGGAPGVGAPGASAPAVGSPTQGEASGGAFAHDMLVESDVGDLLEYWIHLYLGQKFNQVFGLARLAELSARFTHLESSKGKIDDLTRELRLQYFRQRHEMIDRNMRELFSARLAFK